MRGSKTMKLPPVRTSISRRAVALSAVVALALAFGLGACSSSSEPGSPGTTTAKNAKDTAKILNQGLAKQRAGNIADAEKNLKEVIKRDPNNRYAYYDLGLICQNQKQNAQAETAYRQAIAI